MRIRGANITGFRNLADLEVTFSPGVNVLLGANGQGKTNILEALNFFALGRSHRGTRNEDLVSFAGQHLHVDLVLEADDGRVLSCEFGIDRSGGRRLRLDGNLVSRRADLIGKLCTVFFSPESVELVRGGPEGRRRFADQGLAGIDAPYLAALVAYQRSLRQKACLLRDVRRGLRREDAVGDELMAWNRDLAKHAVTVGKGRRRWATELRPHAASAYAMLAAEDRPLSIVYRPRLACLRDLEVDRSEVDLAEDIYREFDYIRGDEIRRGRPLTGLQLDDFNVRLGDLDLRAYGSQGETRSAAVAMILAQSDVVYERQRVRPVLFLDDIFSELDRRRARQLQERCALDHQVFIATARADDVAGWSPTHRCTWQVEDGNLTELP